VGIPRTLGLLYSPWRPLGIPSAITPISQLHQSPPSHIPGDRARGKRRGLSPPRSNLSTPEPILTFKENKFFFLVALKTFPKFSTIPRKQPILSSSRFSTLACSDREPPRMGEQSLQDNVGHLGYDKIGCFGGIEGNLGKKTALFSPTVYRLWRAASGARRLQGYSPSACRAPERGPSPQSTCSNIETRMDRPKFVVKVMRGVA